MENFATSDNDAAVVKNLTSKSYSWEEIQRHKDRSSRWLVIDNNVYDVTEWSRKHPGGSSILGHFAGQDATEAFHAFHRGSLEHSRKYLRSLNIGKLENGQNTADIELKKDFKNLLETAGKMGLFDSSLWFFGLMFLHIVVMDVASYLLLLYFGTGWIPWTLSVILFATAQTQLAWYQHDAGHLSVFKKSSSNRALHQLVFCVMKGVSTTWWNHLHYQHHAKPNIINKDPDVRLDILFVLGDVMPVEKAKSQEKATVPYNKQHKYFFFIMPPLLFPVYFQFSSLRFCYTRKLYWESFLTMVFFLRLYLMYKPLLGLFGLLIYYEVARVIESHWFVWVSQSNHIPMTIEKDDPTGKTWLRNQLSATCNIEKSFFNDWFTGHLNFQIEHHLFPQMPRHNCYKIAPMVKSLCEKYGIEYKVKTLAEAFADVVRSLKKSGALWLQTYEEFHS